MKIYWDKLTPGPWEVFGGEESQGYPDHNGKNEFWCRNLNAGFDTTLMDRNHATFIALARVVADLQLQHPEWTAEQLADSSWLIDDYTKGFIKDSRGSHPWEAWYNAGVARGEVQP